MDVVQAYLFVCRFLTQATDGRLDDAEWSSIVLSLARHTSELGYTAQHWQRAMDRSRDEYTHLAATAGPKAVVARFRACVAHLRDTWGDQPGVLEGLLEEFWQRARIDHRLHPMEQHFLQEIERAWQRRAVGTPPL